MLKYIIIKDGGKIMSIRVGIYGSGNLGRGVENAIKGKECTFSAFIVAAVRAALEDLKK